jgi:lipid-A-disaccharide synthase
VTDRSDPSAAGCRSEGRRAARSILLVAGEASGDLHAGRLAAALRARDAGLDIAGMGGPHMRAAGVRVLVDASQTAVVGLTELWDRRQALRSALRRLRDHLTAERPSLLVCVDFPDFNLLLARTAHRLGIPVCYFISPQVWAWRRGRVRTIRRLVRQMLVFFPFEERLYREAGIPVRFVGHPLLDVLADAPDRQAARQALGIPADTPTVVLLPGSRLTEIDRHLPLLLAAGRRMRVVCPGLRLVVALAPHLDPAAATKAAADAGADVVHGRTTAAMRAADVLLAVSGTVTLEAAILGTPMVITYRLGLLSWLVGRLLVRVRFIGLPNLVAGRAVVPELIQFEATPERLARAGLDLLLSPDRAARTRTELAAVGRALGQPGAAERAAAEILALLPAPASTC